MWSDTSVFYQIYPLGAFGCPFENDYKEDHRILKVKEWIHDLKDLGIDAVLFNPVFLSHTHGYDTIDYTQIDNRLGNNDDFKQVVCEFHNHDIKVIIDAVFNHVGRGFFAFEDVLKNRENSRYKDWFYINFWDNNNYNDNLSYQNWEGNNNLIKLNLQNREVVNYLMDVVTFWKKEFHIDGLRLDVAYCLDQDFLKTLKYCHGDIFLMGETLHGDYNQWVNHEMLDSCTNYECYKGLYSAFNSYNLFEILHSFHRQFGKDPWCLYQGKHLVCFVDNHDVVRTASQLKNPNHLPLIYVMLMTMPGIPCIYYGSEWGIQGEKNWNDTSLRPEIQHLEQNELTEFIKKLIDIKHKHKALHDVNYQQIILNNMYCIYERKTNDDTLWIALNINENPIEFNVDYNGEVIELLSNTKEFINNKIFLNGYSAKIYKLK